MTQLLPDILQRRFNELSLRVGDKNFFAYSVQSLYWLLGDPDFGPLVKSATAEYVKMTQTYEKTLESHYQEGLWLLDRMPSYIGEASPPQADLQAEVPPLAYMYSLQRGQDIKNGTDRMAGAMPIEAASFGEDRTKAGTLISILDAAITGYLKANPEALGHPEVSDLFLDIAYLADKQAGTLAEIQIRLPGLAGNVLQVLARQHRALVGEPKRYESLDDRARTLFQIPPHLNAEMVRIREEVRHEKTPDESFHRQVLSLWRTLFHDLADRWGRRTTATATSLLETPSLLVLTANTPDAPLWVEREVKAIKEALWGSAHRNALALQVHPAAAGREFMPQLDRNRPQLLHFSGHGDLDGLCFVGETGNMEVQDNALVVEALRLSPGLRLAVFMSCHSETLARAAIQHVDAAIGMKREVADADAPIFSAALYQALSQGRHLQDAFDIAIWALNTDGGDADIPVLVTRQGVDPASVAFQQRLSALM